jgi:hypothetical protein
VGNGWTLAGAAFVMPVAGLKGEHVRAPDYPSCALALRRVIRGRAMQAPAVCGRGPARSPPAAGSLGIVARNIRRARGRDNGWRRREMTETRQALPPGYTGAVACDEKALPS